MSIESIHRVLVNVEKIPVDVEAIKLQIVTKVMPAVNALLIDMSSEDSVVNGVVIGAALGTGFGVLTRLSIGERELMPSRWDDAGAIGTLAIVGGLIGGFFDYSSKAF